MAILGKEGKVVVTAQQLSGRVSTMLQIRVCAISECHCQETLLDDCCGAGSFGWSCRLHDTLQLWPLLCHCSPYCDTVDVEYFWNFFH